LSYHRIVAFPGANTHPSATTFPGTMVLSPPTPPGEQHEIHRATDTGKEHQAKAKPK
jgi:hypothetical protein